MMEKEKNCGCAEQAAHTPDNNLFLDMHPDDARALSDYNCYAEQLAALKDLYVKNYGPLSNFGGSVSPDAWKWVRADWPWHSGHYGKEE